MVGITDPWKSAARAEISRLAATGERFTADDVLEAVGHPDSDHEPNSRNNAVGSCFSWASKQGIITAVGVERSRQVHRKHGMVRIWVGVNRD